MRALVLDLSVVPESQRALRRNELTMWSVVIFAWCAILFWKNIFGTIQAFCLLTSPFDWVYSACVTTGKWSDSEMLISVRCTLVNKHRPLLFYHNFSSITIRHILKAFIDETRYRFWIRHHSIQYQWSKWRLQMSFKQISGHPKWSVTMKVFGRKKYQPKLVAFKWKKSNANWSNSLVYLNPLNSTDMPCLTVDCSRLHR